MKKVFIKITLQQLLSFGAEISYVRKPLNNLIKPHLLGFKNKYNIFDLKQTKYNLRALLNIIVHLIFRRHKILVVNHYKEMVVLDKILDVNRCSLIEGPWLGGVLTNYKIIKLYTDYAYIKNPSLQFLKSLPSLLILLNTIKGNWSLKEGVILNIPVGVVTGATCESIQDASYPILAGNDTSEGGVLYANLIKNAVLKGLIKEKIRIVPLKRRKWK